MIRLKSWRARLSLSTRLMIYSVVFTYVLLIGFWTILFLLTKQGLIQQDQEVLKDRIRTVSSLLTSETGPSERLSHRIQVEWVQRDFERIWVRVYNPRGEITVETPTALNKQILDLLESTRARSQLRDQPQRFETENHIYQAGVYDTEISGGAKSGKYVIEIVLDRTNEQTLLGNFRKFFFLLLAVGGIASLWLGRIMVRIALRPIRDVTAMAARVNSERLSERIDPLSLPLEFREVAITMNDMLDRLGEYVNRLTRFSQDMAHELRTPVNNLIGSMEVGLSRERSIDEYKNLLGSGLEECDRLKRIIDSLMFIARTSDPSHLLDKHPLQVGKELSDIVSFYKLSAEEKNIQLKLQGATHCLLEAERTYFQRCVGNLLSNSIRHSLQNSEIILMVKEVPGHLVIQVIEFGCGMPQKSLQRIGERFFRTDESRSKIYGGTGLGLSIAKSIVEMHGGQMRVESAENVGTTISLQFPSASPPRASI